ncbi:transposase [Nonomuraea angiospora]|uniref:IS66 family transposase n=1 Tax=Nonomuraea angiospora TaxID=46172 RepID=UPI0033ECBA5E
MPVTSRAVARAIGWTTNPVHVVTAGRDGPAGGDDAIGFDAGDGGVLVHGDPELGEDLPHVRAALGREPVAKFVAGGERDVQVRASHGDLGRGLPTGEAADDDHGLPGLQAGQALAQPQRSGPAGDLIGVLSGPGDALGVTAAAESVDEFVLANLVGVVVHDRYQNYDAADLRTRDHQLCAAHLIRDLEDCAEAYPSARWPGQLQMALRA